MRPRRAAARSSRRCKPWPGWWPGRSCAVPGDKDRRRPTSWSTSGGAQSGGRSCSMRPQRVRRRSCGMPKPSMPPMTAVPSMTARPRRSGLSEAVAPQTGSRIPWSDLGAGLCVAGLLIPEAVAYAGLAHLPVAHALTAALVGLLAYALFGGSRFAIVAPTSSTATLAAAAALTVPAAPYADAFVAIAGLAGFILILLAAGRQGQLSAFVSRPVLRSFAFALAITIVVKQLPDALGLSPVAGSTSNPW